MLGAVLDAVALAILMSVLAKHEAENNFLYNIVIALGVGVGVNILSLAIGFLAILAFVPAIAWAVNRFAHVTWPKAWLIGAIFLGYKLAMIFLIFN